MATLTRILNICDGCDKPESDDLVISAVRIAVGGDRGKLKTRTVDLCAPCRNDYISPIQRLLEMGRSD